MLVGIFSLGVLVVSPPCALPTSPPQLNPPHQILCAILNRYYNFTGGFGDLIYLNWYAGETSTAVIVVNVPHLWPLISRVLGLGSFKASTTQQGIESKNRFAHQSKGSKMMVSNPMRSQTKDFDHSGYIRSESEERIYANAEGWTPKVLVRDDIEMGNVEGDREHNVYATTVEAGRRRTQDEEEGVWGLHHENGGMSDGEGIVKTVHLNQYAE